MHVVRCVVSGIVSGSLWNLRDKRERWCEWMIRAWCISMLPLTGVFILKLQYLVSMTTLQLLDCCFLSLVATRVVLFWMQWGYYKELVNKFFFVLLSFWSSNCKNSIQMPHPWLGQLVPLKIETPMMCLNAGLHFYGCFQILILNVGFVQKLAPVSLLQRIMIMQMHFSFITYIIVQSPMC